MRVIYILSRGARSVIRCVANGLASVGGQGGEYEELPAVAHGLLRESSSSCPCFLRRALSSLSACPVQRLSSLSHHARYNPSTLQVPRPLLTAPREEIQIRRSPTQHPRPHSCSTPTPVPRLPSTSKHIQQAPKAQQVKKELSSPPRALLLRRHPHQGGRRAPWKRLRPLPLRTKP